MCAAIGGTEVNCECLEGTFQVMTLFIGDISSFEVREMLRRDIHPADRNFIG